MNVVRWLIALSVGIALTLLQFTAVGMLNQEQIQENRAAAIKLSTAPVIVEPIPNRKEIPMAKNRPSLASERPKKLRQSTVRPSEVKALAPLSDGVQLSGILSSLGKISLGDFEGGGMQPSEPDRPARIQRAVEPTYPSSARRDGIEGFVVLRLQIDVDGHVRRVDVVDSEPIGVFEQSARDAARKFKFEPSRAGGRYVPVTIEKKISFRLQ